jgi:hypothetical protein
MMIRVENVTERDLELLTAALDNGLTAQEQDEFNRRLTESPHLTNLSQQQRQLKSVIGQLPARKVPHNFTLTRAEALKVKQGRFLQPLFGWASLISALVVAVIFGSELIFQNVLLPAPAFEQSSQHYELQEDAQLFTMEEEGASLKVMASEPVYLLNWGYGAVGIGGIGGGGIAGDSGSVNININIPFYDSYDDVEEIGTGDIVTMEMPQEDWTGEYSQNIKPEEETLDMRMENHIGGFEEEALLEQETMAEPLTLPTSLPLEREAPRIFGINPENEGMILKVTPALSLDEMEMPSEEQASLRAENQSGAMIPAYVKVGLLFAVLVFGLIWLYFRLRR